ncbi:uncharacterized protein LOC144821591 isoform X1 [Lissotriton helveticus]
MSEASSGGIQTCASQVKIKEIEEASTSDEQIFMARVEVKGDMTTSSDWRDDIQQVVIGEASGSDCQAYESHTKFENRMQTSSNHWGYNQHVIEESEEVAASDPPSYLNPVKIKEGKEAFSHDGQHDMETERVEEASPNEHHASVSHIKLEAEEASFNGFQYHMKLVGIEEGEKASASDRQVCRGLVTTEEVSATGSQDLVSQVTAEEGDELSSMDQPTCLWHIKVEDDDACGIDQPACISQIKIEEEDVSIDEQACMRHIKVEEEAYAIGQQACIKPPMFGKDEAYANDEQTCASHLKMEEQMHAADQQASVSQVKTEGGMECSIRQTPAQDLMGLEECVGMEVEEGPSSVCYQNAIVQLISSKEGEMIGENGRYVLVKLAIAGGNTTSAREQQNLLTQVEMQREKSFVGELKNLVGHSNIDTKADPPGPCKIKKKEGPPCMDFHRPMNQEVAVAEQHTPWHLDEYTVYMDVEEGKEQLVSRDPLVQEGHMPSASPYNSSTVQECQLALSDDHNSSSHKDDEQSSSNECDLEFQDDEDLSDWEYHDWRNFVSNDPKDLPTMASPRQANYVPSRKGNQLLKYDGYLYCKDRMTEPRRHWRCVQYFSSHCTGRAVTLEDTVIRTTEHNHSASAMEIEVRENVQQIKRLAHTSDEPCGAILREVTQNIPIHVAGSMPSVLNLRRMVQRQKLANNPHSVTPQTYEDINIPPHLTVTFSNEPFLLHDNKNPQKRILIFSTTHNLATLENSPIWMMDGTFKSTPHPFTQIYTIHAIKNNTTIPLVYALLPDKNSSTYTEFLTVIKTKILNKSPAKVIIDFELTMINTVTNLYPDAQIQGCFFHFSHAFWQKVQKSSLVEEYLSSSKLQFELRKLTALCFVPPGSVDDFYTSITESDFFTQNEAKLAQLLNYFEDTWIGRLCRSGCRRKPRFPIEWWNCYATCLEGGVKTNNSIEGWHNSFNKLIGKPHPNFYNVLEILKKEQGCQELRLAQSLSGSLNPRVSKKSNEMSERLLDKIQEFSLMGASDYLDSIAYILHF